MNLIGVCIKLPQESFTNKHRLCPVVSEIFIDEIELNKDSLQNTLKYIDEVEHAKINFISIMIIHNT